jgi:isopentenyldiphosphate isomerase
MPCGHKQRVEDAENRFWKRAEDGLGIDRMKKSSSIRTMR